MSSSDRTRNNPTSPRPEAPGSSKSVPPNSSDPYANWLDRMQRARARHAAITKNLHTWSNYKSWADRMKDSWDDGTNKNEKDGGKE